MILERAVVRSVDEGRIHVRVINAGSCPRCDEGKGCGSAGGVMSRMARRHKRSMEVTSRVPELCPGDRVVVGIDPGAVFSASVLVVLLPVGCMLALGAFASGPLEGSDLLVAAFGATGLAAGWLAVRWRSAHMDLSRYRPVILRRDKSSADECPRLNG